MIKYIILALVFYQCIALFDQSNLVRHIKNYKAMERLLVDIDQAEGLIEVIAEEQRDFFRVFAVKCDGQWDESQAREVFKQCNPQFYHQLPQVSFYEPPVQRFSPSLNVTLASRERRYEGEGSPKALTKFGFDLIPAALVKLNSYEAFEQFQKKESKLNKVILFTEKPKTSALYRQLALNFVQRLHFAEVVESKETNSLLDAFNIEDFPQLYILWKIPGTNDFSREKYKGELNFRAIKSFLQEFAQPEKIDLEYPEDVIPELQNYKEREQKRKEQELKEDKEMDEILNSTQLNEQNFESLLLQNEKPALVHIHEDKDTHVMWMTLQLKYRSLFNYFEVLVTEENQKFVKEKLSVKQYPSMRFFSQGSAQKKLANKVSFSSEADFEDVTKDISDLFADKSYSVTPQDLGVYLNRGLTEGKACLFLFYNTPQVGLTFRLMSSMSEFQKKIMFLSFKDAPEQILQQFHIKKQPQIIVVFRDLEKQYDQDEPIKQEDIRMAAYNDKMYYNELSQFLRAFLQEEVEQKSKKNIIEVNTQEEFSQYCSQGVCFIALLNGQIKNEQQQKWDDQMKILEQIKNKYGQRPGNFIQINAACHTELLVQLEIPEDAIPNYVVYTSQKYGKMIGRFDYESLDRFMDKYYKGSISMVRLGDQLKIETLDCAWIYEERLRRAQESKGLSNEDDDILKEILEEEKQRRREMDKDLKQKRKNKKNSRSDDDL